MKKYLFLLFVILFLSILSEYLYKEWFEALFLLFLLFFSYKVLWLYFNFVLKYMQKKREKLEE